MIKYRVWDKVDSRYLEATRKFDYYISSRGNLQVSSGYDSYKEPTYEEDTDQDRYIVELFTGLQDKNGKDVFENDIIDGLTVTYAGDTNGSLGMNAGWYLQRDDFESFTELVCSTQYEISGHIHEVK